MITYTPTLDTTNARPVSNETATPHVSLIHPYLDPPATFRATSVAQMYSIETSFSELRFVYSIGVPVFDAPQTVKITNTTVSHELAVSMSLPPYFIADTAAAFVVPRGSDATVLLHFKEAFAQEKSVTKERFFVNSVVFDVAPLDVRGPVHVSNGFVIFDGPFVP